MLRLAQACMVLVSAQAFMLKHPGGIPRGGGLQMAAELRLLIQGTKNAYTTVRSGDVLYYKYEDDTIEKDRALGLFTDVGTILPLCNRMGESLDDFYVDTYQEPLSAKKLIEEGKLQRIVSSDKRGEKYVIEEYIDTDVYIPVRDPNEEPIMVPMAKGDDWGTDFLKIKGIFEAEAEAEEEEQEEEEQEEEEQEERTTTPTTSTQKPRRSTSLDREIELVKSQIEVASLKVKLIELEIAKNRKSSSSPVVISTPLAPLPVQGAPYSQAIKANGLVFVSGCLGINPSSNKLVTGGIEAQITRALANLRSILLASDSDVSKIVKVTIMMDNMADYPIVNRLYDEFLDHTKTTNCHYPARSAYEVGMLPLNALVEIEAIAIA